MFSHDIKQDATLYLQGLLDRRGIVTVEPGTYIVSRTLIIHSDTRLILAPGTQIVAAPESRCALIENEAFSHGGRDRNIGIYGGCWDGNCDAQGLDAEYEIDHREDEPYRTDLFKGKLIRFAHIDHIALEKLTVKDPVSYGVQIADAVGFVVRDITFDYNCHFGTTDGVHINGPAYNGVIENLHGTTNDDLVSLTTIDEQHAEVTKGEIANVEIRNICGRNAYSGIRLLSAGDFEMRCIRITGVYGDYRHQAVLISHHNTRPNTRIWFDDIILEHIHSCKSGTPLGEGCFRRWEKNAMWKHGLIWVETGIDIGNLIIRDVYRHEKVKETTAPLIKIDEGAKIRRLLMENVSQTLGEGVECGLIENDGSIEKLIERDIG